MSPEECSSVGRQKDAGSVGKDRNTRKEGLDSGNGGERACRSRRANPGLPQERRVQTIQSAAAHETAVAQAAGLPSLGQTALAVSDNHDTPPCPTQCTE